MIKKKNFVVALVGTLLIVLNYFIAFLNCGNGMSWGDSRFFCKSAKFLLNFPLKWNELVIGFVPAMILHLIFYFLIIYTTILLVQRFFNKLVN